MEKNICVFCSSSDVLAPVYLKAANIVGETIAKSGDTLVFGGANAGLMKATAQSAKKNKGKIIGVIPQKIADMNLACDYADKLIISPDMHSRKAKMEELAHAFIVMPGGFGTLEELSEIICLKQLGYHNKPIVILNINNFYDNLFSLYEKFHKENFAKEAYKNIYFITDKPEEAFDYIENYKAPEHVKKWF